MARHNREGRGSDQRGYEYVVSYQPDWLRWIKVSRRLASGRRSTKTLFQNPGRREQSPGDRVRTRVTSDEQGLNFEITVDDPKQVIKRIVVETAPPDKPEEEGDEITFTIEDRVPPPNGNGGS